MDYLDIYYLVSNCFGDFSVIFLLLLLVCPLMVQKHILYNLKSSKFVEALWPMYILEYVSLPLEKNLDSFVDCNVK